MPEIFHFESVEALRDFAARPTPANADSHAWINSDAIAEANRGDLSDWFGAENYQQAQAILAGGWPEGVERMTAAMKQIDAPQAAAVVKRRKTRGDSGDEFDWQAAAQGMNDIAWTRPVQKKMAVPRTVTLFCDLTFESAHHTPAEQFFWRGAAVLYLADALSSAGYNVQIIASSRLVLRTPSQPVHQFNVVLKQPNMPVNLSVLASALCLAAFTRVLIFSANCAAEPQFLEQGLNQSIAALPGPGEFPVLAHDQTSARQAVSETIAALNAH